MTKGLGDNKVSVIIPARNELFLNKTVDDLFEKAAGDIEVIVILDGYWPEVMPKHRDQLKYIHRGRSRGMRNGINSAVAIATGKYIMKTDAHCMFGEGYDEILKADLEPNWVSVPRRYSLDPENWQRREKHPIDYLWCEVPKKENNYEINVRVWGEKNYDKELQKVLIDDVFTFQGSCWFMYRDYFYQLELMDEENYGSFRKEPQEITFKAWLSGGRAIRNKKTWYAHLHKGATYGRGYSYGKADYRKGDLYLINWLSDSAWDKQTIPFRWMIEKFDMPEWDSFDWSLFSKKDDLQVNLQEPQKERRMTRVYQNIPLPGIRVQNKNRENSKFWNEGKWNHFVKPLLPDDVSDMTFIEMGCNAGLFLKMAKDEGFRNVIGIEKDKTPVRVGNEYKSMIGYDYKLIKRALGGKFHEKGSFTFDELPFADYTLLSTFHYYIDINSWLKYLDMLKYKTRNVIVISRPSVKNRHWLAKANIDSLNHYFVAGKDWTLKGSVEFVDPTDDPSPRDLFSVMYATNANFERVPLHSINIREDQNDKMQVAMMDLAVLINSGQPFDLYSTTYYNMWKERKSGQWSERTLRIFVKGKYVNMMNVNENGLKDPIIVDDQYRLCDGGHRLAMLKVMGYESAVVRVTC